MQIFQQEFRSGILRFALWRMAAAILLTSVAAVLLYSFFGAQQQADMSLPLIVSALAFFLFFTVMLLVFRQFETILMSQQSELNATRALLEQRVEERTWKLRETSRELEKSLQAKSEFLATMSHEIRTPMNGVLGMTQLLSETPLNEKQQRYLAIVNSSGSALLDVLNNILDYSKLEAGKMEVENIPFSLENLIDECLAVFSLKALEKKVRLVGGLSRTAPRVCRGDPTRLRQVIMNLLANAIKFTFNGQVSLFVSAKESGSDEKISLSFEVVDTGIGIPEKQQGKLFEAFSQTEISTSRKYGGTGLGLAICKNLIGLMGGEIGVESEPGVGSTFWIKLSVDKLSSRKYMDYQLEDRTFYGESLLLVDSDITAADIFGEQLSYWGLDVSYASSAQQAMQLLRGDHAGRLGTVLLSDNLADVSGIELASRIEAELSDRAVKVLLVTPISAEPLESLPSAVFKILERPVSSNTLFSALQQVFQQNQMAEPITSAPVRRSFSDVRALIAEDNKVNQMVITGILKKFDIVPVVVDNGIDALSHLDTEDSEFDLVLMDCEMPTMDGWEAAEKIRQMEQDKNKSRPIKIVALSAHVTTEPRNRAFDSGMDKFVAKPVDIESVEQLLHEYFPRPSDSISR